MGLIMLIVSWIFLKILFEDVNGYYDHVYPMYFLIFMQLCELYTFRLVKRPVPAAAPEPQD